MKLFILYLVDIHPEVLKNIRNFFYFGLRQHPSQNIRKFVFIKYKSYKSINFLRVDIFYFTLGFEKCAR